MLFQIGLLREYLELEFRNPSLPFPYDVERVIDDFVLFCMLIGNDFLPGMPETPLLQRPTMSFCHFEPACKSLLSVHTVGSL